VSQDSPSYQDATIVLIDRTDGTGVLDQFVPIRVHTCHHGVTTLEVTDGLLKVLAQRLGDLDVKFNAAQPGSVPPVIALVFGDRACLEACTHGKPVGEA